MGAVEDVRWGARGQLFPWGNVDPSGNPLLASDMKKIALAQHCKHCHELNMSSTYSSGLNWLEQIYNLHLIWNPISIAFFYLQNHTWHVGGQVSELLWAWLTWSFHVQNASTDFWQQKKNMVIRMVMKQVHMVQMKPASGLFTKVKFNQHFSSNIALSLRPSAPKLITVNFPGWDMWKRIYVMVSSR